MNALRLTPSWFRRRAGRALGRIGFQASLGAGVGVAVVMAYLAWSTWGQLVLVAAGLALIIGCYLIVLYPVIGVMAVAFVVTMLPTLMMPKVLLVLMMATLVGIVVRKLACGDPTWRTTPFMLWSCALLAWLVISIAWASSYDYVGFVFQYNAFLLPIIFTEVVRTRKELRWVVVASAAGVVVTGLIIVYGFYELISSGVLFRVSGAAAALKNARFFGVWNNPNALAYSIMPFVVLSVAMLVEPWKKLVRVLLIGSASIGSVVIMATLARGAFLCSGIALVLVFRRLRWRWYVMFALALLVVAVSLFLPTTVLNRIETLAHGRGDASVSERSIVLRSGIEMIEDSFPFGLGGGGTFRYSTDYSMHRLSPIGTHNSYVDVLAEGGLVGGLLMLGMVAALFAAISKRRLSNVALRVDYLRVFFFASLVAVLLGMNFENVIGLPAYWLFFTIVSLYPVLLPEPLTAVCKHEVASHE